MGEKSLIVTKINFPKLTRPSDILGPVEEDIEDLQGENAEEETMNEEGFLVKTISMKALKHRNLARLIHMESTP